MTKPLKNRKTPKPLTRINSLLVSSLLILSLSSCANIAEVDYQAVMEEYESLKRDMPERVVFDFKAACNKSSGEGPEEDPGDQCIVTRGTLQKAANTITSLNDARQEGTEAYNEQVQTTAECEYAKRVQANTIKLQERQSWMEKGESIAKQGIILSLCALTQ